MNRYRRDGTSPRLQDDYGDEESLYERQALISDDDEDICDPGTSPSNGPINRRHKLKNSLELRKIQRTKDFNNEPNSEFTYYDIQPGDSLQSICLRYACQVNQVKRLNGLMTDQEFYGLRRLKLPLGKLGLLEDVLKQQEHSSQSDLIQINNNNYNSHAFSTSSTQKFVNSPGSALSITNNPRQIPRFKPLLSQGYSSDSINHSRVDRINNDNSVIQRLNDSQHLHNSHSFSSLREFDQLNDKKNVRIDLSTISNTQTSRIDTNGLRQKTFIKSDTQEAQITIDALLTDCEPVVPNVFEDLDYHVEQAKAAAETYDKRAAELTGGIDIDGETSHAGQTEAHATRISKIPELFFSGENFGLNLTKLIVLIFFICLVVPFVYMNQVNVVKKQL